MMKFEKICKNLLDCLETKGDLKGEVHSIFTSAVNILMEDGILVSLIKAEKGLGPYSMALNCQESFQELPIGLKEPVSISKDMVKFLRLSISLDGALPIDLSTSFSEEKKADMNLIEIRVRDLRRYLLISGNPQGMLSIFNDVEGLIKGETGMAHHSSYRILLPKVKGFLEALKYRNYEGLTPLTSSLVGFGVGLTPSSDDFLCGVMAALLYGSYFTDFDRAYFFGIFDRMLKDIDGKTTLVSKWFLLNSGRGLYPLFMKELCQHLFLKTTYHKYEFRTLLQKTLSFGATSGTDILCGIYIGTILIKDYFGGLGYE